MAQPSRKYQYIQEDEAVQTPTTQIPRQIAPRTLFDPENFFDDFNTGNPDVQAFMYVECAKGGLRNPCGWFPLTCVQINQGTYSSWWETLWDGFTNLSMKRNIVIKKNAGAGSALLQRWIKIGHCVQLIKIAFIRRVRVNVPQVQSQSSGGSCQEVNCYGRCGGHGCGSRRFDGGNLEDWASLFPDRQAAFVITAFCNKISGSTMYFGDQCRSRPGGGCNIGCQSYPGPTDPSTWSGGPGLEGVGADWQVIGTGPNFPDRPSEHGLGSLGREQYLINWSSMRMDFELRNPINGCVYAKEGQIIPV